MSNQLQTIENTVYIQPSEISYMDHMILFRLMFN